MRCYESVRTKYPDSEIAIIPGTAFVFIVKKSNRDILYVETIGMTTNVTTEFKAFRNETTEGNE